ncbi:TlpA family protein disulfide reductase [Gemella cuniculi]|uniref:TlpA family protein disulfide reductase n=1 Tax=Gemella cuniculi TaxID=150240 RepID=UPI00041EFF9B|nr:TlpA disulfide reductase family protein [Gemella cuniculi]
MKKNIIIVAFIFIIISVGAIFLYSQETKNTVNKKEENISQELLQFKDKKIPEISFIDKDNQEKKISDFMNDKPTYIMVWASWCPDCQKQLPEIQKLYKKYSDKVNFVLINAVDGERETVSKASEYMKKNNYDFPYYRTSKNTTDILKVKSIPTTYITNKKGDVKVIHTANYTTLDTLQSEIENLIKE